MIYECKYCGRRYAEQHFRGACVDGCGSSIFSMGYDYPPEPQTGYFINVQSSGSPGWSPGFAAAEVTRMLAARLGHYA
jgi:hypothetical protein